MIRVAALPYRFTDSGSVEVLLITSRRKRRWILPKGKLEQGEAPEARARQEAYEEAGIEGTAPPASLRISRMVKPGGVRVYPLLVTAVLDDWPEMNVRERLWVSVTEALVRLKDDRSRECITAFARAVSIPNLGG